MALVGLVGLGRLFSGFCKIGLRLSQLSMYDASSPSNVQCIDHAGDEGNMSTCMGGMSRVGPGPGGAVSMTLNKDMLRDFCRSRRCCSNQSLNCLITGRRLAIVRRLCCYCMLGSGTCGCDCNHRTGGALSRVLVPSLSFIHGMAGSLGLPGVALGDRLSRRGVHRLGALFVFSRRLGGFASCSVTCSRWFLWGRLQILLWGLLFRVIRLSAGRPSVWRGKHCAGCGYVLVWVSAACWCRGGPGAVGGPALGRINFFVDNFSDSYRWV